MIVAAAIKFRFVETNEIAILCGVRHGDVFVQLKNMGFRPKVGYVELEQGFVTHENQFLNRYAAYKHAKECGQLPAMLIKAKEVDEEGIPTLYSEDLW